MSYLSIVKNPIKFRDAFLAAVPDTQIDDQFRGVINVLLYYVWRGALKSTTFILQTRVRPELGLICLSIYKSFLPIIQLTRLGYGGDAFVLIRAMMERIALLGYLNEKKELIPKYTKGVSNMNKDAMKWIKNDAPENWMHLYSVLSNIAHSRQEGVAVHIFEANPIGEAFRYMLPSSKRHEDIREELMGLLCYAMNAIDPIAALVLNPNQFPLFPEDKAIRKYVSEDELRAFRNFLVNLVDKYSKI